MDKILFIVGIFVLLFTIATMIIFVTTGAIPDTLVSCVFSMCSFEGGFMALIKTTKFFKRDNPEDKVETSEVPTAIEEEDPPEGKDEI